MDKQQFILAYVLARASVLGSSMDAIMAATDGEKAWDFALRFAPDPFDVRPHSDAFKSGGHM